MPRSCGSSRGLKSGSTKRGELHHIATGHGPMVQGGLLTAHPGGVHGYGWFPGGGSSFWQGAGAAYQGSPDLEMAARAVQMGVRGKQIDIRGFRPEGQISAKGGTERGHKAAWRAPGAT